MFVVNYNCVLGQDLLANLFLDMFWTPEEVNKINETSRLIKNKASLTPFEQPKTNQPGNQY